MQIAVERGFECVQTSAEAIRNDEAATVGTVSPGDVVRQGDLYLVCITGHTPKKLAPTKERQLAPGTTQGSRHALAGACAIHTAIDAKEVITTLHKLVPATGSVLAIDATALVGPVFETLGQVEVQHPEHGNRILPEGEWFAVIYQRALADEVRRQVD